MRPTARAPGRTASLALVVGVVALLPGGHAGADAVPPGRWHQSPEQAAPTAEQRALAEQLESLGYVQGSRLAEATEGVVLHTKDRASAGLNFFTSGHGPTAVLMDMDGRTVHDWNCDYATAFPDRPEETDRLGSLYWRHAALLPNGDVLAVFEGLGLIRVDLDSNVLWAKPNRAHHDLQVTPAGDIYVLTREAHVIPRVNRTRPVLEDFISVLGADGEEKNRVSLLECFENSPLKIILEAADVRSGDLFHTNSLEILDGRGTRIHPAFTAGNILTSMRRLNTIVIVDLASRSVVWAHQGDFVRQHDPRLLANGNVQLFDNGASESRVLEIDAANSEVVWEFRGSAEEPFFSAECGTAQRLVNGNTLITESEGGRAFEVTPAGETVWEFHTRFRAGARDEYTATLFEMLRLAADFPVDWIRGAALPYSNTISPTAAVTPGVAP